MLPEFMIFKVDSDPDPGKDIEVDPAPGRGFKWIRTRQNVVDPDSVEDPDPLKNNGSGST